MNCVNNENGVCTHPNGLYAYQIIPDENKNIKCPEWIDIATHMTIMDSVAGFDQMGLI
jgi:hypothetical protein